MVQAGRDVGENCPGESGQASARRTGVFARQSDDRLRIAFVHVASRLVGFQSSVFDHWPVASAYAIDSLLQSQSRLARASSAPRERQLCEALERRWSGHGPEHAIIAPSFRVTFATVEQVYCVLSVFACKITPFAGQDGRADRAEDGWHDGGRAAQNGGRFADFMCSVNSHA